MIALFFVLSIAFGAMRNILSKEISDIRYGSKNFYMIQAVIFGCGAVILGISGGIGREASSQTLILSCVYAVFLISAQYCYTSALKSGNVGICSTVYSLGFIFPTLSGSILWNETMNFLNIIGIILVIPTIIICGSGKQKNSTDPRYIVPLVAAMISSGGLGVVQKLQQHSPSDDEKSIFLFVAFALASIISLVFFALAAKEKKIPSAKKIFSASGIGVAFAMSNFFNTSLAGKLDSAVFFPLLNIGTIIFSLILGICLYKEKFTKKDLSTLMIAITAIILITR